VAAASLLLGLTKDNARAAGDGDDDEGRREGGLFCRVIWSGWQQDSFFVVFVCV